MTKIYDFRTGRLMHPSAEVANAVIASVPRGLRTKELIDKAIARAQSVGLKSIPDVLVDSGTEKLYSHVDGLFQSCRIRRIVAQIDIKFSNSMIEMLFRRLKEWTIIQYFLLDTLQNVVARGNFDLTASNENMPHSALKGATPKEAITGLRIAKKNL